MREAGEHLELFQMDETFTRIFISGLGLVCVSDTLAEDLVVHVDVVSWW